MIEKKSFLKGARKYLTISQLRASKASIAGHIHCTHKKKKQTPKSN